MDDGLCGLMVGRRTIGQHCSIRKHAGHRCCSLTRFVFWGGGLYIRGLFLLCFFCFVCR